MAKATAPHTTAASDHQQIRALRSSGKLTTLLLGREGL